MLQRYLKCSLFLVRNSHKYNAQIRNISNQCANNGILKAPQTVSSASELNSDLKRSIPLNSDEFKNLRSTEPSQPENPRLLRVSVLGEPNVGKSTLTNSLVKWRVCAVSRKVHTTRKKARAILVEGNTQIVFLDTPGFVTPEKTKKHSLEASFVMDPLHSIREADIIAVVVDISDKWTNNRINTEILRTLYDFKETKSILIMNKIDAMKSKNRLLGLTRTLIDAEKEDKKDKEKDDKEILVGNILNEANKNLVQARNVDSSFYESIEEKRGWPLFSKVFMVSALKNDGIEDLRNYLLSEAVPRNWMFNEGIVTDQHPHEIALMTVRENLLEYLPNEIPYKLGLNILKWEMLSTGCPRIDIQIKCINSRHRSFVIGPDGKHIAACVAKCKKAMRESFRTDVVLKLLVV